ncbi:hypothetical protein ILYODFUR_038594, partial [Ilyodon furcidens]
ASCHRGLRTIANSFQPAPATTCLSERQENALDLYTFLFWEVEKMLHHSAGLSVPKSAYNDFRLAIPCPGTGSLRPRSSSPSPCPAPKPKSSSRRRKRWPGAAPCCQTVE